MSSIAANLLARVESLNNDAPPKSGPQIVTHVRKTIKVSIAELQEAIAANPRHKIAKVYRNALKQEHGTTVTVEAIDLEALLKDQDVTVVRGKDNEGSPYSTKQIKERPIKEAKKQGRFQKPKGPPTKEETIKQRPVSPSLSPKEEAPPQASPPMGATPSLGETLPLDTPPDQTNSGY